MHIFFSAIGGAGIGPLAQIAHQAGYTVSGSDMQDSSYIQYLKKSGINNIQIGQSADNIAKVHAENPIDWFVHSSAVPSDSPEIVFCREQSIKVSKRDELLNQIVTDQELQMIAIAGTHGKTTTTAMVVWLLKQVGLSFSYALPAKTSYAEMGHFEAGSQYFVYEADEFDRNFLNFEPFMSLISGVSWDHHEIFPTRDEYQQAFRDFINQSDTTVLWQDDYEYLSLDDGVGGQLLVQDEDNTELNSLTLKGLYNRRDAWLAIQAVGQISDAPLEDLVGLMNNFPGADRRMERIADNLYTDYAHTPEKIRGAMSVALEMAADTGQDLVVIYEPLTNRRQTHLKLEYKDCFTGAAQVYWTPSYLAREDPNERILEPGELITYLSDPTIAQPAELNEDLRRTIQAHLDKGDMVVGMAGGGGGSLDDWLRAEFSS